VIEKDIWANGAASVEGQHSANLETAAKIMHAPVDYAFDHREISVTK
jgi:hypothetical protein